jgi:hypothetical protein
MRDSQFMARRRATQRVIQRARQTGSENNMPDTKAEGGPVPAIFGLMSKVMSEIGPIAKDRKNQQQNYQFRGIDDLYQACNPVLVRHGVFVVPTVLDRTRESVQTKSGGTLFYTVLTVKHTFYAPDGSSVEAVTVGEAMDSGDKSSNKAMSAAMKYALIEAFAIPTDEPIDTENQSHDVKGNPKPAAPPTRTPQSPKANNTTFTDKDDFAARFADYGDIAINDAFKLAVWNEFYLREFTDQEIGLALGEFCDKLKIARPSDANVDQRKQLLADIFGGLYDKHHKPAPPKNTQRKQTPRNQAA